MEDVEDVKILLGLLQPFIRILRLIYIDGSAIVGNDPVRGFVVQGVLFVGTVADEVGDRLDIVRDFFVGNIADAVKLGILEAELVTVVGVDLQSFFS